MKPRTKLAETTTTDGGKLTLYEHDGAFSILIDGLELMHSKATASEILLGERGVARIQKGDAGRVLIGGLGLGYTLAAVLEHTGKKVRVDVAELIPEVIDWNHRFLQELNGGLLGKERVHIHEGDVTPLIKRAAPETWDVILLDIDNGPTPMVAKHNASLYSARGIEAVREALTRKGRAIFWSASSDKPFATRLRKAGFDVQVIPAMVHDRAKKPSYLLYVADK